MFQNEGLAQFQVGDAFYRADSQGVRNFGVLAATLFRRQTGHLRILDLMTGCGVRTLRYALESQADWVWANEGNPALYSLIQQNLAQALAPDRYQVTSRSAQSLLGECLSEGSRFDLVDIDGFGSPLPYLAAGIAVTRLNGFLFLTATDGKSLSGHDSARALAQFNAYTRWHPAIHEQALRVILGATHQLAQFQGLNIWPIFSVFCGKTYRVMVQVTRHPPIQTKAKFKTHLYGFLGYCHHCGEYQVIAWRSLSRVQCHCQTPPPPLVISGPLWLGPLHNPEFVHSMQQLAWDWGWSAQQKQLVQMATEADLPPFYYPLAEIGRRGQMDIPNRDRLIQVLRDTGYEACRTSITAQALKTTAALTTVIQIARTMKRLD